MSIVRRGPMPVSAPERLRRIDPTLDAAIDPALDPALDPVLAFDPAVAGRARAA